MIIFNQSSFVWNFPFLFCPCEGQTSSLVCLSWQKSNVSPNRSLGKLWDVKLDKITILFSTMFGVTWQQRALMHCFVASCNDMYCYLAFRQITFSASFAAQLLHRCKSTKIQWRRNLFAKIYQQRNPSLGINACSCYNARLILSSSRICPLLKWQ